MCPSWSSDHEPGAAAGISDLGTTFVGFEVAGEILGFGSRPAALGSHAMRLAGGLVDTPVKILKGLSV
jgi:hypothetical protein